MKSYWIRNFQPKERLVTVSFPKELTDDICDEFNNDMAECGWCVDPRIEHRIIGRTQKFATVVMKILTLKELEVIRNAKQSNE